MSEALAPVEVTKEDRRLFLELFKIPDRHVLAVLDGKQDHTEEMQAIARFRLESSATPTAAPAAADGLRQ